MHFLPDSNKYVYKTMFMKMLKDLRFWWSGEPYGISVSPPLGVSEEVSGGDWVPVRPSRHFRNAKNHEFLIAEKERKSGLLRAIRPLRGYTGAAVMLQRAPRCNAIAAPPESNKALTGAPALPLWGSWRGPPFANICITTSCKNHDFPAGKMPDFWPSQDLKIWRRGRKILESASKKRP